MPWIYLEICTTSVVNGVSLLRCSWEYVFIPEGDYGGVGGGGGYVPPTLVVTPVVSVNGQQVTITWTIADTNGGGGYYQTNANVAIKNASNQTVVQTNVTTPQTATLTVPEGQGYRAVVSVETFYYMSSYEGVGTSAAFDVGPPPPPPPPPVPPFVPSMGMMGA